MNIGFDVSRAFIKNKTGTENYAYQILHNLLEIDQTNTYFLYSRDPIPLNWPLISKANVKLRHIPLPRLWTQAGLAAKTFSDPLDVLFVPSHTLPIIRKPKLKTVLTVHDLGAEYLPQTHQLKQRLYLNYMTHHQLKSATHLIAVSEATKSDIVQKVGVNPNKITVIYEGFNEPLFRHEISSSALKKTLLEYDLVPKSYLLFVGTIQPRKNLKRLIEGYNLYLKELSDTARSKAPDLVLAGGKGWLSDEIYDLPKELGIENKVRFLGYIPDDKLPALYTGAKAFVFPSLFEGFGLPILEALSCNCPVLTSNTSSLPEVGGKAALYVDPESIQSISKGILDIQDSNISKKLLAHAKSQLNQFSWQKAAFKTLAVLESVAKK